MIKVTRKGLTLTLDAAIIPAQGSADVPVQYINDTDAYEDYIIVPKIGWYKKMACTLWRLRDIAIKYSRYLRKHSDRMESSLSR